MGGSGTGAAADSKMLSAGLQPLEQSMLALQLVIGVGVALIFPLLVYRATFPSRALVEGLGPLAVAGSGSILI